VNDADRVAPGAISTVCCTAAARPSSTTAHQAMSPVQPVKSYSTFPVSVGTQGTAM
jgi:hypothetical protein